MTLFPDVKFLAVLKLLRKRCPALLPVVVTRKNLEHDAAIAKLYFDEAGKPHHFALTIERRLPDLSQCDALMHEWAHILSYSIDHDLHAHGRGWEAANGRVYRAYQRWCERQN